MRIRHDGSTDAIVHCADERKVLGLLKELLPLLGAAINSLGGKSPPTLKIRYLFWVTVFVNRSAEGYLQLREQGLVDASKLLVRPCLEAVFYGAAAMKERGFLFRKAYSEWKEENKYAPPKDPDDHRAAELALADLKRAFANEQPCYPFMCKKVTIADAAKAAGLQSTYEAAYRVYCQFTHGAMRGVMGELDEATDRSDTRFVVLSAMKMLELLKIHTEAAVPDLDTFQVRLGE